MGHPQRPPQLEMPCFYSEHPDPIPEQCAREIFSKGFQKGKALYPRGPDNTPPELDNQGVEHIFFTNPSHSIIL